MSSDEVLQIIQNALIKMKKREQLCKILLKIAMLKDRIEEVEESLNGIKETLNDIEEILEAMKCEGNS